MHYVAHHAGADHHAASKPDRISGADGDAHASPDFGGQSGPDVNGQSYGKHVTNAVRDARRLTQRGR